MGENTILINECNALRRENHRHRQKNAEQISQIRDLSNQLQGPPGSRNSLTSPGSIMSSNNGSRILSNNALPVSIDPRDILQSRGGALPSSTMSRHGSGLLDTFEEGGGNQSAILPPNPRSSTSSTTSLPRPESNSMAASRRSVSTAVDRGSTSRKVVRNVSTASLGGSSQHLRPSSRQQGNAPGKVIRGSTRPIMEAATARSKVQGMLNELDDNNRLIEMQRIEIGRLREQVQMLVESSRSGSSGLPGE